MSERRAEDQVFSDRLAAGRAVADCLLNRPNSDALVLGLARGGVPVAAEVASRLGLQLDVFVVRKVGIPSQPELALGAVTGDGSRVLNKDVLATAGLKEAELERLFEARSAEARRRERVYRDGRPAIGAEGREAILVDNGLATGASMLAAVNALRARGASRVVIAVPIAPGETCEALAPEVDEILCLRRPHPFVAVGASYEDFSQTSDEEVRLLLHEADRKASRERI